MLRSVVQSDLKLSALTEVFSGDHQSCFFNFFHTYPTNFLYEYRLLLSVLFIEHQFKPEHFIHPDLIQKLRDIRINQDVASGDADGRGV